MERTFYYAFYKKTRNIRISMLLARLAFFLYIVSYHMNKILHKKHGKIELGVKEARENIQKASPKPHITYEYTETEVDETIDLSIIVPIYNYKKVLENCLDSIVHQKTKYRYEIFLVDDGSTDGSLEIVESFRNVPGVHILCQTNQGISAARNHALNHAVGKYIMFVDCDDYLESFAVETLLNEAYEKKCDIVEGGYYTFDGESGNKRNYIQKGIFLEHNNYDKLMTYTGYPWAKVYKRELLEGVRFPVNTWFEDTVIKMILFRRCQRYSYCPISLYGYRKYEGNFTETQVKSTRGLEHLWMLEWMIEQGQRLNIQDEDSLYKSVLYHLGALYLYRIENVSEELQKSAFILGADLVKRYRPNGVWHGRIPHMYQQLEKAYLSHDFALWKHVCQYM